MSNSNYIKGRRKEYKIVKELRERGYDIAQRSAGSHSPLDVFAIKKTTKEILLVQAKPDSMSKNAKKKLEDEHAWLNDKFIVSFKVI